MHVLSCHLSWQSGGCTCAALTTAICALPEARRDQLVGGREEEGEGGREGGRGGEGGREGGRGRGEGGGRETSLNHRYTAQSKTYHLHW